MTTRDSESFFCRVYHDPERSLPYRVELYARRLNQEDVLLETELTTTERRMLKLVKKLIARKAPRLWAKHSANQYATVTDYALEHSWGGGGSWVQQQGETRVEKFEGSWLW